MMVMTGERWLLGAAVLLLAGCPASTPTFADTRGTSDLESDTDGDSSATSAGEGAELVAGCEAGLLGNVPVGETAVARIELRNDGGERSGPVAAELAATAGFELVSDDCERDFIDPGDHCTVEVGYVPEQLGEAATSTLVFVSQDTTLRCELAGSGVVRVNVSKVCDVGLVLSQPGGIDCGRGASDCSADFTTSEIVLEQLAGTDTWFRGWTGDCVGDACVLSLDRGQAHAQAWFVEVPQASVVDDRISLGWFTSLAVDPSGGVHISYQDRDPGDLRYVYRSVDGFWEEPLVLDSEGDVGRDPSVDVDDAGGVHVGYWDGTNADLKYVRRRPTGEWDEPVVVDGQDSNVGQSSDLAVDVRGAVHIAYYDEANGDLKYVYRESTDGWNEPVVLDAEGDVGRDASLAVSDAGEVHVSYFGFLDRDLKYVRRDADGTWDDAIVLQAEGDSGSHNTVDVDPAGGVHVGYWDASASDLKYLYRSPSGEWAEPMVLDGDGEVGRFPSLAVDFAGAIHISYYDDTNGDLKYLHRGPNGIWGDAVVLDGEDGRFTSLGIDDAGGVHISYIQDVALKHAGSTCP